MQLTAALVRSTSQTAARVTVRTTDAPIGPSGRDRPAPAPEPAVAAPPEPSAFARVLSRFGAELQRGEALVAKASTGGSASTLDAGQLILLQAGVYRYAEAVDLASHLIESATVGLKTILQSQ